MTVTNPVARYRFLLEVPDGQSEPDGGAAGSDGRRDRRGRRKLPALRSESCATGA